MNEALVLTLTSREVHFHHKLRLRPKPAKQITRNINRLYKVQWLTYHTSLLLFSANFIDQNSPFPRERLSHCLLMSAIICDSPAVLNCRSAWLRYFCNLVVWKGQVINICLLLGFSCHDQNTFVVLHTDFKRSQVSLPAGSQSDLWLLVVH